MIAMSVIGLPRILSVTFLGILKIIKNSIGFVFAFYAFSAVGTLAGGVSGRKQRALFFLCQNKFEGTYLNKKIVIAYKKLQRVVERQILIRRTKFEEQRFDVKENLPKMDVSMMESGNGVLRRYKWWSAKQFYNL